MRTFLEWLLDEKVVTCTMILTLALMTLLLIHWNADKEYIVPIFGSAITTLVGSLVRGTTHKDVQSSSQSVQTTTVVTPKEETKP